MKKDWEIKTLQDVCTMKITDGTHQTPKYCNEDEGGFPFISAKNVTKGIIDWDDIKYIVLELHEELYKRIAPQRDDILLAKNGTTGVAAIVDVDKIFDIYVTLAVLRPNKKIIYPKYLLYIVNSNYCKVQFDAHLKGIGVPNLHLVEIQKVHIPVPPLEEQKRIVKILDEKFAQLETIKTNAQTNLQNAKELFQSQLAKAFSNTTWEKKRLFEICQNIVDCPHTTPKKSVVPTDYPCIRTSELKNGEIDWTTMQYLKKEEYLKRITRLEPKENDIVYGREGTFGDAVLLPNTHHFSLGQRTMLLRPNSDIINPKFLLKAIISPYVYKQALEKNNGCGVPHVNVADVKNFIIPVPSAEIQKRIVKELDSLSEKVRQLQEIYTKQIANCDELKQAYLQKAFEGEL